MELPLSNIFFWKCLHYRRSETRSREGGSHKEDGSTYQQGTVAEFHRYGDLLGQFVQNVSEMTYNMTKFLKRNALFQWTETHEADFQKLNGVFTSQE